MVFRNVLNNHPSYTLPLP